MKKVKRSELTNFKMVAGNDEKYECVVVNGRLKEWVGIGWIDVRAATPNDLKRYPEVKE